MSDTALDRAPTGTGRAAVIASADGPDRMPAHVWRVAAVVTLGAIMSILDTTIVNVALGTLGRELHATLDRTQWVVTGYMLALAAVIPLTGWAARRFGAKPLYVAALALFTLGSALCGLASSTTELIAFRVVQGLGGGMIMPLVQLLLAGAAGPGRFGRVMSIVGVPAMLAPVLGPALGGVILDGASWRWIFFVNVPIGAIAILAALRILPDAARTAAGRLDRAGLALMAGGLPLFTYGVAQVGQTGGVTAATVIVPALAGAALVVAFIRRALRIANPLLNLRLYRHATFASASLALACQAMAMLGAMILLPLYWQQIRHESVLSTGLLTAPLGAGMALGMPLGGRLTDRHRGGPLALAGTIVMTVATIPFGLIGAHTSIASLSAAMIARGFGIGLGFSPTMAAALACLKPTELPDATPQLSVVQRVGGSLGAALLAVVLQRALSGAHTITAAAAGYGTAFWASAALSALAIAPAVVLVRAERAATAL